MSNRILTLAASILAFGLTIPAHANLVTNGSFESGDLTGWTQNGSTTFNGVFCPGGAPDGSCEAFFGPVGTTGGISQSIATVTGQLYAISFFANFDGLVPSSMSATFGGNTLFSFTNPPVSVPSTSFQQFSIVVTATGPSSVLAFSFRDDDGFINLDNVSVNATTPEPATFGLIGIALAGFAFRRSLAKKFA